MYKLTCGINNVGLSLSASVDAFHRAGGRLVVGGDRLPRHVQVVARGGCHRAGQERLPGQIEHAPVGNPCALLGQTRSGTQHTVGSVCIERVNIVERVGLVQRFRGTLPTADKFHVFFLFSIMNKMKNSQILFVIVNKFQKLSRSQKAA